MDTVKNALGIELPSHIEGYGEVQPYQGVFSALQEGTSISVKQRGSRPGQSKVLPSIKAAIRASGLKSGMTVSFHHHLRNGDKVVNLVMKTAAAMGLKDLHLAASGIFPCHEPLVRLMEDEVITGMTVSTFNPGPVPKAVTAGKLKKPAVLMSHGGRPRAIKDGSLPVDVAFIAAPACDPAGNANAIDGPSACGCLSYAYADAEYAGNVVIITDHLVPYPAGNVEIGEDKVDYVVCVDSIGDPNGIVSGTTKITTDPIRLKIASDTAKLVDACGYLKNEMSFQTGASSTSLAVATEVEKLMLERGIVGSFGLGGIHAYMVHMLETGLFRAMLDVQCFDLDAVRSVAADSRHIIISGSRYADLNAKSCVVNHLDVVILGATEIDLDYNVNVITGSNGVIMGASGGHSDCAAGSKMTIIVSNLMKKDRCLVKQHVTTITTPGETVDALVTDYGIAVNPARTDLLEKLTDAGLPLVTMEALLQKGMELGAHQDHLECTQRIVGVVEYRDGTVLDVVRQSNS